MHNGKSVGMESRIVGSPTSRDIDIDLAAWSDLTIRFSRVSANFEEETSTLTGEPIFSIAPTHLVIDIHSMNRSFRLPSFFRLPRG